MRDEQHRAMLADEHMLCIDRPMGQPRRMNAPQSRPDIFGHPASELRISREDLTPSTTRRCFQNHSFIADFINRL